MLFQKSYQYMLKTITTIQVVVNKNRHELPKFIDVNLRSVIAKEVLKDTYFLQKKLNKASMDQPKFISLTVFY